MKAVILAGGKGTRLRPLTYSVPKPLLPYKQKPILEHIINKLKSHGITDIIISIGHLGYQIKNYFGAKIFTYFTENKWQNRGADAK